MSKETFYIGDEHGTQYFSVENGNVVGTEVTQLKLQEFMACAEKLGFKVGKL